VTYHLTSMLVNIVDYELNHTLTTYRPSLSTLTQTGRDFTQAERTYMPISNEQQKSGTSNEILN
jgi:hypothetical protein